MSIQLAGCVILDESGKIFLLHRNKKGVTQWELPGGKVEPDETFEQAAIREVAEELGVTVSLSKKIGGDSFVENDIEFGYTWFGATIESGEMTICEPETFDGLKSFSIDELSNLQLSKNMEKLYQALIDKHIRI